MLMHPCVSMNNFSSYSPPVGLKHVSEDQKTHKNPNLRSQATPTKKKSKGAAKAPTAAVQKRPPLLELEGKKWRVVREVFTVSVFFFFLPLRSANVTEYRLNLLPCCCRRTLSRNTTWWSRRRSWNKWSTSSAVTTPPCRLRAKLTPSSWVSCLKADWEYCFCGYISDYDFSPCVRTLSRQL